MTVPHYRDARMQHQKGVYVIPCVEQSTILFPLVEQESSQGRQMDISEVEVEEVMQARVKKCASPPDRQRERGARGHACDVSQLVRGVCGRTCD